MGHKPTASTTSATQPSAAAAIVTAHKAKEASEQSTPAPPSPKTATPKPAPPKSPLRATTVSPPAATKDDEDSEDDETAARNAVLALAALEREADADAMGQTLAPGSAGPEDKVVSQERGGESVEAGAIHAPVSKGPSPSGGMRGRSSGLPTHETIAETDDEEDWDLIDAPTNGDTVPSEANGGKGQNLFARGVVDTYRLLRRQDSTRLGPGSGGPSTPTRPFSRLSRRQRNHLHRSSRGDLTSGSAASLDSTQNINTPSRGPMTPSSSTNIGAGGPGASSVTFEDQQQSPLGANGASAITPMAARLSASIASSEDVNHSAGPMSTDRRQSRIKRRFTTFFEQATR